MHLFSWKQLLLRASFDSESKSKKTDPIQHPGVYELPKDQVLKNYPRQSRGFFIDVFSSKHSSVRFIILLFLLVSIPGFSQIVVDPKLGLDPWFKSWYQESEKMALQTKIRGKMDKDIIKLYLTVLNGKKGESGEVEGVSRAIFPTGKYRLVQPNLEYVVVPEFPKEPPPDMYGVSVDWSGFYDRFLYNDSVKKRAWDPFVLSPNKYRTLGLALSQKRMEELSTFLEKDIKTENDQTGIYPERPVMGESAKQVSEWINLIVPHWRNRWIFRSFPTVHGILIDKKRTQAILKYGIHNGGGIARYRKEGKEWVLVESRINTMQ